MRDYEKDYKDALNRMVSWMNGEHPECFDNARAAAEFVFPDLKEDYGERIRKELIKYFDIGNRPSVSYISEEKSREYVEWLEKQCKQSTESGVNPTHRFNNGDWLVPAAEHMDNIPPTQVIEITNRSYALGVGQCLTFQDAERLYRLWTIQDAMPGDVLANSTIISIYMGMDKHGNVKTPCIYTANDGFEILDEPDNYIGQYKLEPATRKQREKLFNAAKKAGYVWCEDKLEFKEIDEKQYEEDELIYQHCKEILHDYGYDKWLEELMNKKPWKPNTDQMMALAIASSYGTPEQRKQLSLLHSELKKL